MQQTRLWITKCCAAKWLFGRCRCDSAAQLCHTSSQLCERASEPGKWFFLHNYTAATLNASKAIVDCEIEFFARQEIRDSPRWDAYINIKGKQRHFLLVSSASKMSDGCLCARRAKQYFISSSSSAVFHSYAVCFRFEWSSCITTRR